MKDKICIVTGANSGIGKSTAEALAHKGAHLLMVCRNQEKAEKAKQEITEKTGNEKIDIFLADLSLRDEVKRVAQEIKARFSQIDVLVNNAGIMAKPYREITADGIELTLAVNHMAYFTLTNLLIDELKASPAARVINISSEAHRFTWIDLEDLHLHRGYNSIKAYALSKLCNILFTVELDRRLKDTKITTNAVHPGGVATNFGKQGPAFVQTLFRFMQYFLLSPDQGANTAIYLASSPEVAEESGKYFSKRKPVRPSAEARDALKAKRLWTISTQLAQLEKEYI